MNIDKYAAKRIAELESENSQLVKQRERLIERVSTLQAMVARKIGNRASQSRSERPTALVL